MQAHTHTTKKHTHTQNTDMHKQRQLDLKQHNVLADLPLPRGLQTMEASDLQGEWALIPRRLRLTGFRQLRPKP